MSQHAPNLSLGICCMPKKYKSKHMKRLVDLLSKDFEIVAFSDKIMALPPEEWPVVDCMIAFYSDFFPFNDVLTYLDNHPNVAMLNDLKPQKCLLSREEAYNVLEAEDIPLPPHVISSSDHPAERVENGIKVGDHVFGFPVVEKPINAEDHSVRVYYKDGTCREMHRKVGNQSSRLLETVHPRNGAFLYEDFMDGPQDIKVYVAGPNLVHAEARRPPTVDGIVMRDKNHHEIRSAIKLTPDEMKAAVRTASVFDQWVCGLDLLRRKDGSFAVIDVNGWSFVKHHDQFYPAAAKSIKNRLYSLVEAIKQGKPRPQFSVCSEITQSTVGV